MSYSQLDDVCRVTVAPHAEMNAARAECGLALRAGEGGAFLDRMTAGELDDAQLDLVAGGADDRLAGLHRAAGLAAPGIIAILIG